MGAGQSRHVLQRVDGCRRWQQQAWAAASVAWVLQRLTALLSAGGQGTGAGPVVGGSGAGAGEVWCT